MPEEVIRAADVVVNRRRGGEIRLLLSPKSGGSSTGLMGTVELGPGEYVAEHYHPYSEEYVYVVTGSPVMVLAGRRIPLAPRQALLVPIGTRHRLENPTNGPVEVVFHLSPLAPRPELGHVDTEPPPARVTATSQADR